MNYAITIVALFFFSYCLGFCVSAYRSIERFKNKTLK